jgi:alpha-1,2-mannosyltransferase
MIPRTERRATLEGDGGAVNGRSGLWRAAVLVVTVAAVGWGLLWYGNPHGYFDLKIYRSAMTWWVSGHHLYDFSQPDQVQGSLGFTYPPFAALLLRPLAYLPLGAGVATIWALTAIGLGITVYWLVTPVAQRHGWPRWYAVGLAFALAAALEPIRGTIYFGQINMLLVLLVLADLLIAVPRGSRWAGIGIGLATAIKLIPGIFIVYLLISRRTRAGATAVATAVGATLLAAAVAPGDSWRFWTDALWATNRVGRTDYSANQSLLGMLSRLTSDGHGNRPVWLLMVLPVLVLGLWRARQAATAGDEVVGLTLAGLVGSLVSPITWPHHLFWFIPAFVVLADASVGASPARRTRLLALLVIGYATVAYSVISVFDYGLDPRWASGLPGFLLRNWYVLLMLALVAALPVRADAPRLGTTGYAEGVESERSV